MKQCSHAIRAKLVALAAASVLASGFAQDAASVWLSNLAFIDTSGSASSVIPFGRDINNVIPRLAQAFRTGPNADGYLVTSVTLPFANAIGKPTGFTLQLFSAAGGQPDASLGALTGEPNPDRSGNYTYSAPSLVLRPNTLYFLVLEGRGTEPVENDQYLWYRSGTYTADSNDGWQIGGIWYSLNGGQWTLWSGYPPGSLEIRAQALILDTDGDGVPDSQDECPNTPAGAVVDADGCSIDQLVPCGGPPEGGVWKNHGEYVSAVAKAVRAFLGQGLITREQAGQITGAAAKSDCGKERRNRGDLPQPTKRAPAAGAVKAEY